MERRALAAWCSRCQGMVIIGDGDGVCFDEEAHYLHDSADYAIGIEPLDEGMQDRWRCCNRCRGLIFSGFGNGVCYDGDPHSFEGSDAYGVYHGVQPDRTQDKWFWCSSCQGLAYSGFSNGYCWDGQAHYPGDSGAYSVEMIITPAAEPDPITDDNGALPTIPPPAPLLNPTIVVTEQGSHISVDGQGFTPNGQVYVAFVRGSRVKKVPVTADEAGVIWYQENDTVGASGSTVVIGRDATTDRSGFGQSLRLTPRTTSDPVVIDSGTNLEEG
jgi:hypothetical protein